MPIRVKSRRSTPVAGRALEAKYASMDNETGKEGLKGRAGSHSAKCPAHPRHLPATQLGLPGLRAPYLRPEVPNRSKHLGSSPGGHSPVHWTLVLECPSTPTSPTPGAWLSPSLSRLSWKAFLPACQPASGLCAPAGWGSSQSRDCGLSPTPLWSGVQCLAQSRHRERVLKEYFDS